MGKEGHIEDVFILPEYRNLGIGKKLIQFLIQVNYLQNKLSIYLKHTVFRLN